SERLREAPVGVAHVGGRLEPVELVRSLVQLLAEGVDVLVERGDVDRLPELRTGCRQRRADPVELLLVLRFRDVARLATAGRREDQRNEEQRDETQAIHGSVVGYRRRTCCRASSPRSCWQVPPSS